MFGAKILTTNATVATSVPTIATRLQSHRFTNTDVTGPGISHKKRLQIESVRWEIFFYSTSNDRPFGCPIIYTDIYSQCFCSLTPPTMLGTIKLIDQLGRHTCR